MNEAVITYKDVPVKVTRSGEVYSFEREVSWNNTKKVYPSRKLVQKNDKYGYKRVRLNNERRRYSVLVHRLVALAFIENPDSLPCVNHKNEIKTDNIVNNL